MNRSVYKVLAGSCAALAIVVTLGACAARAAVTPASSHSAKAVTPSVTPSPTPIWPPALPPNALFQITALATANNGGNARLTETVFEPVAQSTSDSALLDAQCGSATLGQDDWRVRDANSLFLDISITATLLPGSPAFLPGDESVYAGLPGGDQAYTPPYRGAQAPCASGFMMMPGVSRGVGFVPSADPALGTQQYGLIVGWAVSPAPYALAGGGNFASIDGDHLEGSTVVSDCYIQLSPAAQAVVKTQKSWIGLQATGRFSCPSY
ncbi:MAG TPA: hypothetical protein VHZ81_03005 [Galbitalea sp.]|jgi:hypothetical protein|nr:hypothetical protein [Galbitalea sp.]